MSVKEQMSSLQGTLDIDLLEDALDIDVIKKSGNEDICRCPLPSHNGMDSNPSFSINRTKLVYNCFACGIGGNVIDLVARILNVDYDQAYRFCKTYEDGSSNAISFGERLDRIFASQQQKRTSPEPIPRFNKSILKDWTTDYCPYFESRGIHKTTQDRFALGFDPNHQRGNYVGPAAIIPHFFEGNLVGYQERWIDNDRPKNIPKYTNSKGFPKGETLFAYDEAAVGNNTQSVVVVESAITAIYLYQLGYTAVATFGAQVTDEQIRLLRSFSWGVILSFDNDHAGQSACDMVCNRLRKTIPVHVIGLSGAEKEDLNDLNGFQVRDLIENAKPWFMKEL